MKLQKVQKKTTNKLQTHIQKNIFKKKNES